MTQHPSANLCLFALAQFERETTDDVPLFGFGHRHPKQPRLCIVIGETFRTNPQLLSRFLNRKRLKTAVGIFARKTIVERIRFIGDSALRHLRLHMAVALEVDRCVLRSVNGDLMEVRAAEP